MAFVTLKRVGSDQAKSSTPNCDDLVVRLVGGGLGSCFGWSSKLAGVVWLVA